MTRAHHGDDASVDPEGTPSVLFSCSLFGTVLAVGDELSRLSGRPAFEVRGNPARALLQPWSHANLQQVLRAARDGVGSGSTTFRFRHADGSGLEVPASWSVLPGAGANPPQVVFALADPAAEQLPECPSPAEEAVSRLSLDAAVVLDAQGTLTYVSPAVGDVFGYEVDDVTGCDVWSFLHPEDVAAARAGYRAVVDGRSPWTAVLRVRAARGDWRWVKLVAVNRLDDAVGGLVFAVHDITSEVAADRAANPAAAASEGMLRVVDDAAEDGIWALSTTGVTLFANPRMAAILGVSPDQLDDRDALSALDPVAAAEVRDRLRTRAERGPEQYEIAYAHPDGRERRLWVSATPLRAEDGSHEGSLATVSDITEVRQAEQWLRTAAPRTPPRSRPF